MIVPTIAIAVNLARADAVEVESRPVASIEWVLEDRVDIAPCAPVLHGGIARVQIAVSSKERFFRVRGVRRGVPGPWFDLPQLWIVALPDGPWTATGSVGGAAEFLPVEGSPVPVIIPVKP